MKAGNLAASEQQTEGRNARVGTSRKAQGGWRTGRQGILWGRCF